LQNLLVFINEKGVATVAIVFRKLERTGEKIFQVRANLIGLIWMKHTVEWQTSLCPHQDLM